MTRIQLAIVTETYDGEIKTFEDVLHMKYWRNGFSEGADAYGGDGANTYTLEEAEEALNSYNVYQGAWTMSNRQSVDMLKEIIKDLSNDKRQTDN